MPHQILLNCSACGGRITLFNRFDEVVMWVSEGGFGIIFGIEKL